MESITEICKYLISLMIPHANFGINNRGVNITQTAARGTTSKTSILLNKTRGKSSPKTIETLHKL